MWRRARVCKLINCRSSPEEAYTRVQGYTKHKYTQKHLHHAGRQNTRESAPAGYVRPSVQVPSPHMRLSGNTRAPKNFHMQLSIFFFLSKASANVLQSTTSLFSGMWENSRIFQARVICKYYITNLQTTLQFKIVGGHHT